MLRVRAFVGVLTFFATAATASAIDNRFQLCSRLQIRNLNAEMSGKLLDFTANHHSDNRLFSASLHRKRDLYVYIPPQYDGTTPFPVMLWLHGLGQDETHFLDLVRKFDQGVRVGRFPPMVIAVPDGSLRGRSTLVNAGTFYLNSNAGQFEDYIMNDVWSFVRQNFCIRPEREAHVLAGVSMGGYGAYQIGLKHRDQFGVLAGILPALDIRYVGANDDYLANYVAANSFYRESLNPRRIIGRFYSVIVVRERMLTRLTVGSRNMQGMQIYANVNPVEMLHRLNIRPDEFQMFVGYSTDDEFNLDAQAEHFIDVAKARGLAITAYRLPQGRHDAISARKMAVPFANWLTEVMKPTIPPTFIVPMPGGPATNFLTAPPRLRLFARSKLLDTVPEQVWGSSPFGSSTPTLP